jgi:nonsense-mediated mRNA decay protein 3
MFQDIVFCLFYNYHCVHLNIYVYIYIYINATIRIYPNNANQCGTCLAQGFDLKAELERGPGGAPHPTIYQCRKCRRYQKTPTFFEACEPESPELLAICLKHIPALSTNKYKVKEASWIWTEPHSMRFKVKVTVLTLVQSVMVQQRVMVELHCGWQQCPDCNREYTNRTWIAKVQLRQRRNEHGQKGLLALEQALKSNTNVRKHVLSIDASREGLDFYFLNLAQAQTFSSYLRKVAPMKVSTSQKLVSTDSHNNTAHRKHNITCEVVPLCAQDLVVVEKSCRNNKLSGQLMLILKVKSVVRAISANPTRSKLSDSLLELSPETYHKHEKSYRVLQASNRLVRYTILDVDLCDEDYNYKEPQLYEGPQSGVEKYALADVQVTRESDFGAADADILCCVTHLGHLIQPGDICLGYDLTTFVGDGDWDINLNKSFMIPDVVLVKKVTGKGKESDEGVDINALESKPKLSKKKQRRRRRKENRKMQELEERVERMGFLEDEEGESSEQELAHDPEMEREIKALEEDFAALEKKAQEKQEA